jgi:hypothetical protein
MRARTTSSRERSAAMIVSSCVSAEASTLPVGSTIRLWPPKVHPPSRPTLFAATRQHPFSKARVRSTSWNMLVRDVA